MKLFRAGAVALAITGLTTPVGLAGDPQTKYYAGVATGLADEIALACAVPSPAGSPGAVCFTLPPATGSASLIVNDRLSAHLLARYVTVDAAGTRLDDALFCDHVIFNVSRGAATVTVLLPATSPAGSTECGSASGPTSGLVQFEYGSSRPSARPRGKAPNSVGHRPARGRPQL